MPVILPAVAALGTMAASAGSAVAAGGMTSALAGVSAATGLAGTAVGMAGTMNSAKAAKMDAYYKAQVAANNAKIADQNAAWAIQAGEVTAENKGLQTRGIVGQERAAMGAGGVDVNTGSAAQTQIATSEMGQVDIGAIRANAAKQAYGYQTQSQAYGAESQLDIARGKQGTQAGEIGALGSFLSGISSTAGAYNKWGIQSENTGGKKTVGSDPLLLQGYAP